jgi:hypothetical protein
MGFNPHRKHVPRKADYLFVGGAFVAAAAALAWVLFG